jgi:hypothetical protein
MAKALEASPTTKAMAANATNPDFRTFIIISSSLRDEDCNNFYSLFFIAAS